MSFWTDIILPILILIIAIWVIVFALNIILRTIHFDMVIVKIVSFFIVWYFVGPLIYDWLSSYLISEQNETIKILYTPIQYIYESLSKLV